MHPSNFSNTFGDTDFSGSGLGRSTNNDSALDGEPAKAAYPANNSIDHGQAGFYQPQQRSDQQHAFGGGGKLLSMLQSTNHPVYPPTSSLAPSLDSTDFPALASRVSGLNLDNPMTSSLNFQFSATAAARYQQASFSGHEDFVIQKEDFPALPGFATDPSSSVSSGSQQSSLLLGSSPSAGLSSIKDMMVNNNNRNISNSIGSNTSSRHASSMISGLDSSFPPLHVGENSRSSQATATTSTSIANSTLEGREKKANANPNEKYGLLGLLSVVRMTNKDLNTLALGLDLTSLGMNLSSCDSLYQTFASPWAEGLSIREPQYNLPSCFYLQPPALKTGHLSKFQLETLFYIFYGMTKDVLQAYAAQELYQRDWRYHVDLKLWFSENKTTSVSTYWYFDMNAWEKRTFSGQVQGLTNGFLPEEEVRVQHYPKQPQPPPGVTPPTLSSASS